MTEKVRQAVVIVHGMGEQRPLETLNQFIAAALEPDPQADRDFWSRPNNVTESYEARLYLAPRFERDGEEVRAQTEFYEYHWAHLMQGNRVDDLWPTFRRMLLQPPTRVPSGLKAVWALFWLLIAGLGFLLWQGRFKLDPETFEVVSLVRALVGGGAVAVALTYLVSRVLPGWLTTSFVDVVRYLDTSPRSYEVRRQIRKGMVDLLVRLHEAKNEDGSGSERYQRIVIVAHSLGAFIAYDGIAYLWSHAEPLLDAPRWVTHPAGLKEVEESASVLRTPGGGGPPRPEQIDTFQTAQRLLWAGLRDQGHPWRITDFISLGTPMYFTDRLFTRDLAQFQARVERGELQTCPPEAEGNPLNNVYNKRLWFSWQRGSRGALDHKAAFAVVRWTNMWFPARWGLFGDWFGERLAPLFGDGIRDIALKGNRRLWKSRFIPGYAHALYLAFPHDNSSESVTTKLRESLDLASTSWIRRSWRFIALVDAGDRRRA
ncbi:MAG: hypothetical protein M3323_00990 [Actinomycetota bacterium]|nr:hypothetical protein [Actinomycetota bacterium]